MYCTFYKVKFLATKVAISEIKKIQAGIDTSGFREARLFEEQRKPRGFTHSTKWPAEPGSDDVIITYAVHPLWNDESAVQGTDQNMKAQKLFKICMIL